LRKYFELFSNKVEHKNILIKIKINKL